MRNPIKKITAVGMAAFATQFASAAKPRRGSLLYKLKRTLLIGVAVTSGGLLCPTVNAWENAITDTSGYVVQTATDSPGQSSLINGAHFPGGAPVAGKDYLVNNQFTIRTPESGSTFVFKGDSLTLDGDSTLALKCPNSKTTIDDLRIYNASIGQADGNCVKTLEGKMTVFGTPSAPSMLVGSGNNGNRLIDINATVCGASGTCLQVKHTNDADKDGCEFYVRLFKDQDSTFNGAFEVKGANGNVVAETMKRFGSTQSLTLRDGGGLLGQGANGLTVNGKTISVVNGGRLGSFQKNGTAITFVGGSTISGTGTLLIKNANAGGTWKGPIVMNSVTVSGLDGIAITNNATLAVGNGYSGASVPIAVRTGGTLRGDGAAQTGAVTLDDGATLSLTLTSGTLAINGALTTTAADGKFHVDIAQQSIVALAATNSYRLLAAANLGSAGATLSDFILTMDGASESARAALADGVFSIETENGTNYLVCTMPRKVVYNQGVDVGGSGGSSFETGKRWSDTVVPHSDADYFVCNGAVVRAVDGKGSTFGGHSLSVLSGGAFYAQGATATVGDLRFFGGSIASATRPSANAINGNVAIYGSSTDPVIFRIEVNKGPNEPARALTFWAPISGSGSVRCIYAPGHDNDTYSPDADYPGVFNMRGNNTGFTGEWQLSHFAIRGTFTSAANFGSASALVFNSNGVFRVQDGSFAISAPVVVNNTGSVSGSEELTNGGTFLVDTNQTLTVNGVVSGAGILRKTGAGTLLLNAVNTISNNVVVKAGKIGGAGKVNTLELADGAGFDVSATQATPFEIGALTVDGGITLHIHDAAGVDLNRVAVAKVGTLTGTLDSVKATVDGGKGGSYRLSVESGILYATKRGMVISFK